MDATTEPEAIIPVVFGRSSKKRKAYRQRGGDDEAIARDAEPQPTTTTTETDDDKPRDTPETKATEQTEKKESEYKGKKTDNDTQVDEGEDEDEDEPDEEEDRENDDDEEDAVGIAVTELIRRRKQRKQKIGGVGFRDDSAGASGERGLAARYGDFDLDDLDLDPSEPVHMGMRFAPQTGMIGDVVNKHMEEYVEAQLAKRQQADAAAAKAGNANSAGKASGVHTSGPSTALSAEAREQLAMKGKLHEIDLGTENKQRNIAMTQRATQQSLETSNKAGDTTAGSSNQKPKLGRNGKPLRPKRKRRASDDVERDNIVEQFLHENKMDVDVYDVSRESGPAVEGRPTDDRMAEQFRRDFMEAVALRMRRKRKPLGPPPKPKTRNDEEVLKGPKLGGSRNVRSVMRDKLLQKQEEQRQTVPKYEQELQEQRRRQGKRR